MQDAKVIPGGDPVSLGNESPGANNLASGTLREQEETHQNHVYLKDWQCRMPMTKRAKKMKQARYVVESARNLVKVDGYYLDNCECLSSRWTTAAATEKRSRYEICFFSPASRTRLLLTPLIHYSACAHQTSTSWCSCSTSRVFCT
jgi:hypothetical protein